MKRIVFINRYYQPDQSATARVLTALTVGLARRGYRVHVLTSDQRYEEPTARLPARESLDGVEVHRLATSRFGRRGLAGRTADYLAFIAAASWWLLKHLRRGELVVCKTDPPMLSAFLWPVLALRGAVLVNWLQDLFPEVAVELGVLSRRGAILPRALRNLGLRRAARNVVIGRLMARRLASLGMDDSRQRLIENSCNVSELSAHQGGRDVRERWGLEENAFVVMYSGNLGRAHPQDWIGRCMENLAGHPTIQFVMIGGGAGMERLRQRCAGLPNCRFLPYQPESELAECLAAGDLHLIALKPELEGLIVPSKFYPVTAVARPAVYLGSEAGDIARYLRRNRCGCVAGSSEELAQVLRRLEGDRTAVHAMGQRAGGLARAQFSLSRSQTRWEALLDDLGFRPDISEMAYES
ncbi:MAG: glycosyltransferase family 4 protein [Pseudomonadota bacterium]